jgi:UDP-glucose 4-epimerase
MAVEGASVSRPVLVTGGAGFVGATFVDHLVAEGRTVVVYDNFVTGRRPAPRSNLHVVEGDLRDDAQLRKVVSDYRPGAVYHLAAMHFIPYCNAHPVDTLTVNVVGTQALLEACRSVPPERLVFASSAAVYGVSSGKHGEDERPEPDDIYGLSKLFGERQVAAFQRETGVRCVVARFFNVYGRGETNPHLIPEIVAQVSGGASRLELGNLSPKRDYVHVTDVARALDCFLTADLSPSTVFNVGSGRSASVLEVLKILEGILGRRLSVEQTPDRVRRIDRPNLAADISRLERTVHWRPEVTLEAGLRDLVLAHTADGSATGSRGPSPAEIAKARGR